MLSIVHFHIVSENEKQKEILKVLQVFKCAAYNRSIFHF